MTRHFFTTYDSFEDFRFAANSRPVCTDRKDPSSQNTDDSQWYGTATYAEAETLANEGWEEGRARVRSELERATVIQQFNPAPTWQADVAGAYPIVPLAVAGDPCNMVTTYPTEAAHRPIIRLAFDRNAHSGVGAAEIERFGIAVLSHIDKLESDGQSVELAACLSIKSEGVHTTIQIILKRAGEPLELDRLSYTMGHASMIRRHC